MSRHRQRLTRPEPPVISPEPQGHQGPAFRLDIGRSLQMHPVLAGSVAAAVFLVMVTWAFSRKPVYTAQSLIYVEPLEVRVLNDGSAGSYDPSRYDSYLQQQVQTVERADTLQAAVGKLAPGVWRSPGESVASAAKRLSGALKVERVLNSYQLAIRVTAGDPQAVAGAANAVTAAYLEKGRKDEHARADQRLQLLLEERQRITEEVSLDKTEQASLGKTLGVASPSGATGNPYDLQSEALRSQLASAREAHDAVEAQLASVSSASGAGLDTAANELIQSDPGLISIKQTLSQRRALLSDQMAGLTPSNPVYKQDQEELAAIERAIERATTDARLRAERQLQDKLRLDLQRTANVESRLNAQLGEQTARASGAGPKLQRASELEIDLQRLNTRFATVDDAIRSLQLETGGPGQAHLSLAAQAPETPEPSRSRLVLLLAFPLSAFCGIAAAVLARKREDKIYVASDMQEVLGFPPICVLPSPAEVSPAAYDEFLLRLAGGLEGAQEHGAARVFVFTPVTIGSPEIGWLPSLCDKLRQLGLRAVCINAEELVPGAMRGANSVDIELQRAPGQDGFGLKRLRDLLERNDFVLIQAPPLLGSAITEYVVRCGDATILLAESTKTNRRELRKAALLLERLNSRGVGSVLEGLPMRYADQVFRAAVRIAKYSPIVKEESQQANSFFDQQSSESLQTAYHEDELPIQDAETATLESPEEQAEIESVPEADVQQPPAMMERPSLEELKEEFVPIPTTFTPVSFSAPMSAGYSAQESAPPTTVVQAQSGLTSPARNPVHDLQTTAFETERFRSVLTPDDFLLSGGTATKFEDPKVFEPESDDRQQGASEETVEILSDEATAHAVISERYPESYEAGSAIEEFVVAFDEESNGTASKDAPETADTHDETHARTEVEKPLSWYRNLMRFSEKTDAKEGAQSAQQKHSFPENAALQEEEPTNEPQADEVSTDELHSHSLRSQDGDRPVEFIFRESAEPRVVFASKTPKVGRELETSLETPVDSAVENTASTPDPEATDEDSSEAPPSHEAEQSSSFASTSEIETTNELVSTRDRLDTIHNMVPEVEPVHPTDVEHVLPEIPRYAEEIPYRPAPARDDFQWSVISELPVEPRVESISQPRTMQPVTMDETPSPLNPNFAGRIRQSAGEILLPTKPTTNDRPAAPVLSVADGAARYRPGLARAVRHANLEDGPPARASEGLSALRRGSDEPRAERPEEKGSSPDTQPVPAQSSAGMTRRWGMLSRFQRSDSGSESSNEVLTAAGVKNSGSESGS